MNQARIVGRLDKMVAAGRMTRDEADRLRSTQGTPEFDEVLGEVRARHASASVEAAIRDGSMTRAEADDHLQRLRRGEHPEGLRARLRRHRRA